MPKATETMTRDELRAEAKELSIPGRGKMTAAQLREAVNYFRVETIRQDAVTEVKAALEVEKVGDTVAVSDQLALYDSRYFSATLPPIRNRYKDRVARGELTVRTAAGTGGLRAITR